MERLQRTQRRLLCFREQHLFLMQHDAALPCLYPLYLIWKPQMIGAHLRLVIHVHTYPGVVPLSQRSGGLWLTVDRTTWNWNSLASLHALITFVCPAWLNKSNALSVVACVAILWSAGSNYGVFLSWIRLGYVFLVVRYGLDCCPHRSHRWPKASSHLLHPTTGTNQPMKQEGMLEVSPEQVLFDSYVFFFFWERNLRKHFVSRAQWCLICTLFRVGELLIEFFKCACMSKVVVSIFLDFQLYSGKFSNLTSIFFQTGWNHQLDSRCQFSLVCCCWWLYFCSTKISMNEEVGAP